MTPILQVIHIFIELDLKDARTRILDRLEQTSKRWSGRVDDLDVETMRKEGWLTFTWTRFDTGTVKLIREHVLRLILYPVGEDYDFFLLCKRLFERFMEMQRVLIQQLQNVLIIDTDMGDMEIIK